MFYGMGKRVERMKAPVCNKDWLFPRWGMVAVNQSIKRLEFILLAYRLNDTVAVSFGEQVKKCDSMDLIIAVCSFAIWREIRIGIIRIACEGKG